MSQNAENQKSAIDPLVALMFFDGIAKNPEGN